MKTRDFFDIKFLKFIFVGAINTLFGTALMFKLYNLSGFGYWGSSAVSYLLASILSFFLNKSFTFRNKGSTVKTALRFAVNIAVCYLLSYSISKPLVTMVLSNTSLSNSMVEQSSMLFGMVLFVMLNYTGQRFFAFREKEPEVNSY